MSPAGNQDAWAPDRLRQPRRIVCEPRPYGRALSNNSFTWTGDYFVFYSSASENLSSVSTTHAPMPAPHGSLFRMPAGGVGRRAASGDPSAKPSANEPPPTTA